MNGEIISLETAKKIQDYEERINKAIEYIEKEITKQTDIYCKEKIDGIILLEILKGDSNDRKEKRNN